MTVVAATKYVDVEAMAVLAEAGVTVVGENRAQDLAAKHAAYGSAFRWHFIGHLQSRKAQTVNALCELCHSLDSLSAARRLEIPALVQVNLAGEESKSGVAPTSWTRFSPNAPPRSSGCRRCHRSPTIRRRRGRSFAAAGARGGTRSRPAVDGNDAGLPCRRDEGATLVRVGAALFRG